MLTHGMSQSRIYNVWSGMIQRCENENHKSYHRYGGRGIEVCDEWHDFEKFEAWANRNGYNDTLTIDRIDNSGMYEPDNCKWSTSKEQANNRRTNHTILHNGETHTIAEWADILGVNQDRIYNRLYKGWSEEKALSVSFNRRDQQRMLRVAGEKKTISEWAKIAGIRHESLCRRVKKGYSDEEAVYGRSSNRRRIEWRGMEGR